MTNTNPVRRIVLTEDFDWEMHPVCESDATYVITATADPEEGGTVTVTPQKDEYHLDDEIELLATPNPGWRFVEWRAQRFLANGRNISIYADKDMDITAVFERIEPEGE